MAETRGCFYCVRLARWLCGEHRRNAGVLLACSRGPRAGGVRQTVDYCPCHAAEAR